MTSAGCQAKAEVGLWLCGHSLADGGGVGVGEVYYLLMGVGVLVVVAVALDYLHGLQGDFDYFGYIFSSVGYEDKRLLFYVIPTARDADR